MALTSSRTFVSSLAAASLAVLAACAEQPAASVPLVTPAAAALGSVTCRASVRSRGVSCGESDRRNSIFGGQHIYVTLTSDSVTYAAGIFRFRVSVQNLMNEAIGTPDGVVPDSNGIRVFFSAPPAVLGGTGTITVANADGTAVFTAAGQPYFQYNSVLATGQTSPFKPWQLNVPATVDSFTFRVFISTETQPLLVINEVMAAPTGTGSEPVGEWFEVYNAGTRPVNMQGLVIADSSGAGRRPYHTIASEVMVPAGGYVVLGSSADPAVNGDTPTDYAYGTALDLANGPPGDAIKIARPYGTDTLTIDRVQWGAAQTVGFSKELRNPAFDNADMDGVNWFDAFFPYSSAGRAGSPKEQNQNFTPAELLRALSRSRSR